MRCLCVSDLCSAHSPHQTGWMFVEKVGRCYVRMLPEGVLQLYTYTGVRTDRTHLCVFLSSLSQKWTLMRRVHLFAVLRVSSKKNSACTHRLCYVRDCMCPVLLFVCRMLLIYLTFHAVKRAAHFPVCIRLEMTSGERTKLYLESAMQAKAWLSLFKVQ